jgi:hypothetical protein
VALDPQNFPARENESLANEIGMRSDFAFVKHYVSTRKPTSKEISNMFDTAISSHKNDLVLLPYKMFFLL